MKLSERTVKIIKSFSTINQSMLFRVGNFISTRSISSGIYGEAIIDESIPVEFCIYDLNQFLNTTRLFKDPVLDFTEEGTNYLYICEADNPDFKVRYTFTNKELILYPEKKPKVPDPNIKFELEIEILDSIIKASNIMQLPNLIVTPINDKIHIEVSDIKNSSSNNFSVVIDGEKDTDNFKIVVNIENLKILRDDYHVNIVENRLCTFLSDTADYYIGASTLSRYEK